MRNRQPVKPLLLHCFLPLLIGGVIYLLYRPATLLMFRLIEGTQIHLFLFGIRTHLPGLPTWVIYSLPDALWSYSMVAFILILWKKVNIYWLTIAVGIGVLPELFQIPGWVPGTFDPIDLLLKVGFITLAILQITIKSNIYEESNT